MPQSPQRITDPNWGMTTPAVAMPPVASPAKIDDPDWGLPAAPAAPTSPGLGERIASTAADVGIGALKGLGSSAVGAGKLVTKIPGVAPAIDAVYGLFGMPVDTRKALADALMQPELTPTNAAQRIGKLGEQVAEFVFLPTGKGSLLAKAATQGAGSSLLSGVQGATTLGAAMSGATSAAMPGVGALASRVATPLKEAAVSAVQRGLGPTKEYFKAQAQKLAPDILDRDIIGWLGTSRPNLLEKAAEEARAAGQAVDAELAKMGTSHASTDTMIQAIEGAKKPYRVTRQMTAAELATRPDLTKTAVQTAPGIFDVTLAIDKRPIAQLSKLQGLLSDLGPNATIDQVVAVRRAWDEVVSRVGGYAHRAPGGIGIPLKEQSEAWAKEQGANAVRRVLASDAPSIAAVNKEFSFWKGLKDVVAQTEKRTVPQTGNLGKDIMTAAGAVGGAATGGLPTAIVTGAAARVLNAAFKSPRWNFIKAKFENELSDALTSGSAAKVGYVASKISAFMASRTFQAAGGVE